MSRVEAVITDFGGVLTTPLLDAFARFQEGSGVSVEALGRAMFSIAQQTGANPLIELETGRMREADFLGAMERELSALLQRPVEMAGFGETYFANLHPNERMIGFMRELRERGLRLAICTNNVREWEPRWRAMLPVDEIFHVVVDSGFVGVRKPDREIYDLTLERLDVAADAAVFVDDTEMNVDAAQQLGLHAIHFRETEQAIEEIEAALNGGRAS